MAAQRHWAFERGALWTMNLQDPAAAPVLPQVVAALGEVQQDTATALAAAMGLADPALVLRRFASGRRCFAAWVAGAIASYGWVSRGRECIGELERPIRLRDGEAYIWECATLPPHRRKR